MEDSHTQLRISFEELALRISSLVEPQHENAQLEIDDYEDFSERDLDENFFE